MEKNAPSNQKSLMTLMTRDTHDTAQLSIIVSNRIRKMW